MVAPPSSQTASARPISFSLINSLNPGQNVSLTLNLRPEDLRRTEPALQTPMATLGGAWLDDWGRGLSSIVISGHTGWRGSSTLDGGQLFQQLRDTVWTQWHIQRAAAVASGQKPDTVQLIFADALDQIVAIVAPGAFTLSRSRSRPLLYQYSLSMTVLNDNLTTSTVDENGLNPDGSSSNPDALTQGAVSAANSADTLILSASSVLATLPSSDTAISGLMTNGAAVISTVLGTITSGVIAASTASGAALAASLCLASRNIIWGYVGAQGYSGLVALPFLAAASAFENALCVFENVLSPAGDLTYTDYSSLDGASVCSTTLGVGGLSPYLGQNPFSTVVAPSSSLISISSAAANALTVAEQIDPVLTSYSTTSLVALASALNLGVVP